MRALAVLLALLLSGCDVLPLHPAAGSPEPGVPLQIVHARNGSTLALVPISIDGKGPFPFALDTGASRSLIDQSLVRELGLRTLRYRQQISGVTGVGEAYEVPLERWRVGDVALPATTVYSLDLMGSQTEGEGMRGLLGSDILSRFGVVTIDYQGARLVLRDRP